MYSWCKRLMYRRAAHGRHRQILRVARELCVSGTVLLLGVGCANLAFVAVFWGMMLLMIPTVIVAAPLLPFYYAVEGMPGNTGTQTIAFAPSGDELVVAYQQRKKMYLYRVPLNESPSEQLTEGDRFDFDPSFSPDGKSIVFASRLGRERCSLFQMDLDTNEVSQVTGGDHEDWAPKYSPDGDAIVFTRRNKDTMAHINVVDGNGDVRALTSGKDAYDVGPVFLPDGENIVFARSKKAPEWGADYDVDWARRSLYLVSRTGEGPTQIAREQPVQRHLAKRATEERSIVTSYAGNLVLCEPGVVDRLRESGLHDVPLGQWVEELDPTTTCVFSPDGRRVVFVARTQLDQGKTEHRLRAAVTGAGKTQGIVSMRDEIRDLAFSPDGSRLVFRVFKEPYMERDHYELWTVRFDGSDLRRLLVSEEERKDMEKHERREQRRQTPRN